MRRIAVSMIAWLLLASSGQAAGVEVERTLEELRAAHREFAIDGSVGLPGLNATAVRDRVRDVERGVRRLARLDHPDLAAGLRSDLRLIRLLLGVEKAELETAFSHLWDPAVYSRALTAAVCRNQHNPALLAEVARFARRARANLANASTSCRSG